MSTNGTQQHVQYDMTGLLCVAAQRCQSPIIESKRSMHTLMTALTFAANRRQAVVIRVAVVASEADDARRTPAHAAYGIADPVEGTHVAVAFPATCGHVPVALDAR